MRINFGDVAERFNRGLRIGRILFQHAEVVPGMGIVGMLFCRLLEKFSRSIDSPEVQQRDALIHLRDLEFGIERSSLFKRLQRLFEELLVHVGSAEIVKTRRFKGLVPLAWLRRVLRGGCENRNRRQHHAGTNQGNRLSHAKTQLTTKGTKVRKGKSHGNKMCCGHLLLLAPPILYLRTAKIQGLLQALFATMPLPS